MLRSLDTRSWNHFFIYVIAWLAHEIIHSQPQVPQVSWILARTSASRFPSLWLQPVKKKHGKNMEYHGMPHGMFDTWRKLLLEICHVSFSNGRSFSLCIRALVQLQQLVQRCICTGNHRRVVGLGPAMGAPQPGTTGGQTLTNHQSSHSSWMFMVGLVGDGCLPYRTILPSRRDDGLQTTGAFVVQRSAANTVGRLVLSVWFQDLVDRSTRQTWKILSPEWFTSGRQEGHQIMKSSNTARAQLKWIPTYSNIFQHIPTYSNYVYV